MNGINMFDHLEQFGLRIARLGVWCGGAMMIVAAFIIGTEVVLRKLFLITLGGADEMANYALAISTVWALSFALLQRAHIRVDVIYAHLPKPVSALLDILSLVSLLIFAGTLSWYGVGVWQTSWDFGATANTPLATPLWIPQGLWVMGLIGFSFTVLLLLSRSLQALLGRDFDKINEIAGTITIDEELKEELEAVERAEKVHLKNTRDSKVEVA